MKLVIINYCEQRTAIKCNDAILIILNLSDLYRNRFQNIIKEEMMKFKIY